MKVNEAAAQQLLRLYTKNSQESGAPQGAGRGADAADARSDEVTISSEGQGLQRAIQAAQQAADVRTERVLEIRAKMQSGQYVLDPQAISDRMLGLNGGGE
jgi:flagellar biosynthesis anti-sigma factor FlgM